MQLFDLFIKGVISTIKKESLLGTVNIIHPVIHTQLSVLMMSGDGDIPCDCVQLIFFLLILRCLGQTLKVAQGGCGASRSTRGTGLTYSCQFLTL